MNNVGGESLRNVIIVGSRGAGKTTLAEALLFVSGAIPTLGAVSQGTTISDFEPEEVHHRSSISTSLLRCTWKQTAINFLDVPGAPALAGELLGALQVADAAIVVLNPATGIRSDVVKIWSRIRERQVPCLFFVNEQEKGGTSIDAFLVACQSELSVTPILLTHPLLVGTQLSGIIDLLEQKLLGSQNGQTKILEQPIPDSFTPLTGEARKRIQEAAADSDDRLLERYLSVGELNQAELYKGLRTAVQSGGAVPCYVGSAGKVLGIAPLLNAVVEWFPSPQERMNRCPVVGRHADTQAEQRLEGRAQEPFGGVIFKTIIDPFIGRLSYLRVLSGTLQADSAVYNVSRKTKEKSGHLYLMLGKKHFPVSSAQAGDIVAVGKLKDSQTGDSLGEERAPLLFPWEPLPRPVLSFAIEPKASADVDKVSIGLHKLIEEDPSLEFARHADTKEMVLSGAGPWHLDVTLEKLRRKYGAEVTVHQPRVPYRETIRTAAQAQGKYKKQTGGHGQYGDCWLEVAPLERGGGFSFENKVVGGAIPRNFIPAVERGVVESMHHGVLAGFPVVDLRVAVYDGSYHVVDSSEMSFKIAGSMAFKKAMESAHPILLEPFMTVEIEVPAESIGAVIGDVNARRGRILGVEAKGHTEMVKALVPLAELLTYATALNGLTGGVGSYVMDMAGYQEVPRELAGKIVEEARAAKEQAHAHA